MKAFPITILFSFALGTMNGQVGIKQDSITRLDEVVLIDTLKIRNATGLVASTRVGPEIFQNFSPVDMVNAINQVAGVYILSGALNTNRITIRGVGARTPFGTDKLRMYYNEIPITTGTGFSTIEAFDLEDMSSIEVIKGPKGTAYGTNLGGAVVLNTKDAQKEATIFSNNFTIGSYGLIKNSLGLSHAEDYFAMELQYGHMETDGYRENSRFERDGILLNGIFKIDAKNKIGLFINHIDYSAQISSSISQAAFDEDPRQAAFTWKASQGYEANRYTLIGLSFAHKFCPNLENSTGISYSYLDHYEPRPFNILDEFTNAFTFRTRFTGNFKLLEARTEFSVGGEVYKDEYDWGTFENDYEQNNGNGSLQGSQISDNKEFRTQTNVFGFLSLPIARNLKAQAGLNINKTRYDFRDKFNLGTANKSAGRDFNTIFLPSLELNYSLFSNQMLYANISRGYSNPSLEETLTPEGVINPDIKQETGTNYEIGSTLSVYNGRLKIDLAVYRMDIKNLLVAQRVGEDQFIGMNAGKTLHRGIDLAVNYRINLSDKLQISPFLGYTFSNHSFVKFMDGDNDYSGNPLTGVPKHRLNSGIQMRMLNGFYWNTTLQYVDKISLRDANTLYSDAFTIVNSRIGYQIKVIAPLTLGLDFGTNNLGNTRYTRSVLINAVGFGGAEPRYFYPGEARNYYGSLSLKYEL